MKKILLLSVTLSVILFSCKRDEEVQPEQPFTKAHLSGYSQKGPFLNGSSLTAFELDDDFAQTGRSFNVQILDNLGSFELYDIQLATQYAKLKADGFYFNEVINANSSSPITLYAISDLSDKSTVNVNLLSTLEVSRVEYLVRNGATFNNAKHQAQQEILDIFFIDKPGMAESESLDISVNTDDNAILLATSLILQGYRTESELSQLLGDLATDIRTDGVLNSSILGSLLMNDASLMNLSQIRSNIENKYATLGVTTVIPDFEHYIHQFLDSATYSVTNHITFPSTGLYGINVLNMTDTIFTMGQFYSFSANLPAGTSIRIRYDEAGGFGYASGSLDGWFDFGSSMGYRTLQSSRTGVIDATVIVSGTTTISFYENGSVSPTRIKTIHGI